MCTKGLEVSNFKNALDGHNYPMNIGLHGSHGKVSERLCGIGKHNDKLCAGGHAFTAADMETGRDRREGGGTAHPLLSGC